MNTRRRPDAPTLPASPARRSRGPSRNLAVTPAGDAYLDARAGAHQPDVSPPDLGAALDAAAAAAVAEVLPQPRASFRRHLAAALGAAGLRALTPDPNR